MTRQIMKWSLLLFSSLACLATVQAQYPATGNKMRLGFQTTGDGLVYRGAIADTSTLDPSGINNAWMLLDTVSGNLYAYRVKAWRLVSGGGGGPVTDTLYGEVKGPLDSTYIDTVANIIFRLADTTVGVGEVKYDDTQGSLIQGLKGGNVNNVIGQQIHQRVVNTSGGTLAKGTAVYLHGSQGNRITVRKALGVADSVSANTFGIVAESIADNQSGYVITEGLITNINTNALTEGEAVYLSPTVAGELTSTKPVAPQHTVYIGVCVKQNAGSGELFVKIRNGQELDELHDVAITSPVSNASLYYNASQKVWRDTTGAALTSDTSDFARDFQVSGTANRIAMFTGSNQVGNSNIYQNNGNIGVGVNPSYKFQMFFNNSVAGVQDTLMDLYSANWYPIGIRSRVSNQIANGSYAVIGEALDGHYQENVGVYGIATKSDISGPGANIGLKGEVNGSYNALSTASGATYGGLFINNVRKTLSSGNFNIGLRVITDSAGTYGIYQNGFGVNYFQGNVGIGTASPARALHINNTGAIRIPVGTTAQQGTSAAGDLRYNTDKGLLEWHNGTSWQIPVPVARTPVAGMAGRFAKFDASGLLLDTSAVLVQSNDRIGIGTASPSEQLQVNGTARATRLAVNTFPSQILSINNYAPVGSLGRNVWIGDGGQLSQYTSGQTGGYNVSLGAEALGRNTTGFGNIAVASQALAFNTTGYANVAVGGATLASNTTYSFNTAVGANALQNSNSFSNTAIGQAALGAYNEMGSNDYGYNTAVGVGTLSAKTTGDKDVAIGWFAGRYVPGVGDVTSSSKNIFIGAEAYPNGNGQTQQIVIGYGAVGNGSNTTTIGNSSTTKTILPAGNLGVAVTNTTARLHLPAGTATANTAPLKFTSGTNLTTAEAGAVEWNGTNLFVTNSSATRQTVNQGLTGSATMDFPNTNAQTSSDLTITVTGAADGDIVSLGVSNAAAVNANTCYTAWVSAANTVTVRFNNYSSGAINPAQGNFKVFVTKF